MSRFVQGNGLFFFHRHDFGLFFQSSDNTVHGTQEVIFAHGLFPMPGCNQGGFVTYVGDVGTGETRCLAGQQVNVHRAVRFHRTEMDFEYGFPFIQVRQVHVYLTVKTSGTQQGFVQNVHPVGGSQDDDAAIGAETIHFGQQLVQCVFPFVVSSHGRILSTCPSHGVDFVDEDDARGFFFGLTEQVTYAAGSYANEHFHEVGTREGKERYVGFSGHGLG